jgi:2-amino-3-ketobutyrate coenzyme A ligase (EC 2.3.1.29)
MYGEFKQYLQKELTSIDQSGLFKRERTITSAQGAEIKVNDGAEVLNFCANNYLGLSSHPRVIKAAQKAMDTHGYGMSSVRFICGTQDIHKQLEERIAHFLVLKTRFYMLPVSMPMVVFSSLYLERKMPSFPMN